MGFGKEGGWDLLVDILKAFCTALWGLEKKGAGTCLLIFLKPSVSFMGVGKEGGWDLLADILKAFCTALWGLEKKEAGTCLLRV